MKGQVGSYSPESELQTERDLRLILQQTIASQGKRIDELEKRTATVTGKVDALKGHVVDLQEYTIDVTADQVEEIHQYDSNNRTNLTNLASLTTASLRLLQSSSIFVIPID